MAPQPTHAGGLERAADHRAHAALQRRGGCRRAGQVWAGQASASEGGQAAAHAHVLLQAHVLRHSAIRHAPSAWAARLGCPHPAAPPGGTDLRRRLALLPQLAGAAEPHLVWPWQFHDAVAALQRGVGAGWGSVGAPGAASRAGAEPRRCSTRATGRAREGCMQRGRGAPGAPRCRSSRR